MEETIYSKPLLGYRVFKLRPDKLFSIGENNTLWKKHNLAYCSGEIKGVAHHAPHKDCSCGFNGFYYLENAKDYIERNNEIIGAFLGKGEICGHEIGFRSAEAYLIALYIPGLLEDLSKKEMASSAADNYDVPLFTSEYLFLKYCQKFGSAIPYKEIEEIKQENRKKNYNSKMKIFPKRRKKKESKAEYLLKKHNLPKLKGKEIVRG